MGSDESHVNVSLIVRGRVTRQCPQTTTFDEKGEPKRIQTEVPLPVLNWANICFANIVWAIRRTLKKFGEHSWFLIGRTFGSTSDEAMFWVQKVSLSMFWEYSPSSTTLASDWMRAKRALLWTRTK